MSPPAPPPLSVVIPTRNTRELTLACLDALAAAVAARPELAASELVVVDDGGDDGTAEAIAARHRWVRLVRLDVQSGFTHAANRGLAAAAGELLLLLNSDTEVGRDGVGLLALLARFAAAPGLGIAGGALRYPDGTAQWSGGGEPTAAWLLALASGLPALLGRWPLYRRLVPAGGTGRRGSSGTGRVGGSGGAAGDWAWADDAGGQGREVAWVTGAAMAIRRAAWEQVGPLDERFRFYAQDLDLCLRARAAGWSVALVPEFVVLHHHGATIRTAGGRPTGGGSGARGGPGGRGAQHAELLWTDLLRWAGKHGGAPAARRAARALAAGARLRLAGRRLAAPFVPAAAREGFRADSAALARGLAAVQAARETW